MTYEIRSGKVGPAKCGTDNPECLPGKEALRSIYSAGYALYKEGHKLSLSAALKEVTKP